MPNQKDILQEIIQINNQDSFLVFDRTKDVFTYPIHIHPEIELNFIKNGKGLKRVVGDHFENIGDLELVLIGPNLLHGWEQDKCKKVGIREVTIQFQESLFGPHFLQRNIMRPLSDMFERSSQGIAFSEKTINSVMPRILEVAHLTGINYFLGLFSLLYELSISEGQIQLAATEISTRNFRNSDKFQVFNDYVQKNYSSKISLEEIASVMNMSTVTYNRFIKRNS